jgi:hypothetical protein
MSSALGAAAIDLAAPSRLLDQRPEQHLLDIAEAQRQPTSPGPQFSCGKLQQI